MIEINSKKVLNEWYERTSVVAVGHYRAALRYSRLHFWIAMPTVALSAVVGTAVFATLQQQSCFWLQLGVGAMSVLAAILTALQSTLRYQELAEKHRSAGAKYNALGRELELMRTYPEISAEKIEDLRIRIDSLAFESPHIPQSVHEHMQSEKVNQWG
ncbi:SLATT domain-containing protein [Pseudomonas sp. COW5]|uniref:SLATT domain-containing protein n=1 Tax=Pseudomonas sp. COW5 TaxID=2981253 RepID=UPI002245E0F7|nr:SLATT domain-containing protein [Pseudomonas sp. COW5]MCX2546579.1 SLATT domain-containing protein [Pseudomonas sp. COW5]